MMSVVVWLSRGLGLAIEILIGITAYVCGLLLLGYLRSADMLTVRRLLVQ